VTSLCKHGRRAICAALFFSGGLFAVRMSPAVFVARDIPVGKATDLGIPLVLSPSEGESEMNLVARVLSPGQIIRDPIAGFENIPEGFFVVEGEQPIYISKDSPAVRRLIADIPADSSLYNRRFMVQLWVSQDGSSGNIQSAIVANYLLEMESHDGSPTGGLPISISPSVLELDESGSGLIAVTNNDTVLHSIQCRIGSIEPSSQAVAISLSPGFEAGDASKFSVPADNFLLGPAERKLILVKLSDIDFLKTQSADIEVLFWAEVPSIPEGSRFVRLRLLQKR